MFVLLNHQDWPTVISPTFLLEASVTLSSLHPLSLSLAAHSCLCVTSHMWGCVNWGTYNLVFSLSYSKREQFIYPVHHLVAQTVALMTSSSHEGMTQEQDQMEKGRRGRSYLGRQCWLWKYGLSECEPQCLQFSHGMENKQTWQT